MADKITMGADGVLAVSDNPIIPFIEGDGTGVDIWPAAKLVMDAAASKHGKTIEWLEVLAGEKAFNATGNWLPDETVQAFNDYLIGIKGPLTTPIGGGIRSLNVALRQLLDLYVCLRPVRWYEGVPSPVKHPELVDMVIFRENTEDIYAGLEFEEGSAEAKRLLEMLAEFGGKWAQIRKDSGLGLKPISVTGSKRLIRAAIEHAITHDRKSVTMVHKGNIQKFTEGAFAKWGYDLVREEFADKAVGWDDCGGNPGDKVLVKDNIADITLQQVLTRPTDFDVIATTNLNGDYLSDALAAQVGGIGIAPGANINYVTGHGIFEATHGTAPKYAGQDKVNPGSVLLSGVMMFRHLGWQKEADDIERAMSATIADKVVTYDFARQMEGATEVKCSEFAAAIVDRLQPMDRLRALLIAPPGAGKGTQADRICAHFGISHISTGDMFRDEVARGTELGLQVAAYLDRGDLVPDDTVGEMVRVAVVAAMQDKGGYLLDGFPRTVAQAQAAHTLALDLGIAAHGVVTFDVPRPVLLERLMARGAEHGRSDDDEQVIKHRLDVYDRQTAPLLEYYAELGILVRVNADAPVDDVTAASIAVLEEALLGVSNTRG